MLETGDIPEEPQGPTVCSCAMGETVRSQKELELMNLHLLNAVAIATTTVLEVFQV